MSFRAPEPKPDFILLEQRIAKLWEEQGIRRRYLDRNRDKEERFSFIDGPITANNPMGVHHAWGRTLKDIFQRYHTMLGHAQRYQNGFDSQGLWVEVEVEKSLGLNSKKEIEEYGLEKFAEACRARVAEYARVITDQSERLGYWMDWGNDYFTFSDTNISYIWRFLAETHRRGWLYQGPRATEWCPRCGTSLSQHEQTDSYKELTHPSLFIRLPIKERPGEALVIWTTTPWTVPANVAAAVKPDAEYVVLDSGDVVAKERLEHYPEQSPVKETLRGSDLVGLVYEGPFDDLPAQEGIEHRVIAWDDVTMEEGTGIVHIAPGCGAEDYELGKEYGLAVVAPAGEDGRILAGFGDLNGKTTDEAAAPIMEALRSRGLLVATEEITHRYPVCWRCGTPLIFRLVDDWYIRADEIRPQMLEANAEVEWRPAFYQKRMDDWLRNMGDWNISRKRYYGLPLPFYPCTDCGKLNVISSREELERRATAGLESLKELHRPWIDAVTITCEYCGAEGLKRIPEVGDAWLDAGIVPFSTLGWENKEAISSGYATGASAGLSGADLPSHEHWEQWFPAELVSEMREQIRLWFYAISFMAVTLVGKSPYRRVLTYEKLHDEAGREMHKSWGNAIEFAEAADKMGVDAMRWLYARQAPEQNMNFGYAAAEEVKRQVFLILWNSYNYLATYASASFRPEPAWQASHILDRWIEARRSELVGGVRESLARLDTPAATREIERFISDLSTWYIRRSRSRFAPGAEEEARRDAEQALHRALVTVSQVMAPITPFLAEELYQGLVVSVDPDAPPSVHLTDFPETGHNDEELLSQMEQLRAVVSHVLAHRAAQGVKLRQPLGELKLTGVEALSAELEALLLDEVNCSTVSYHSGAELAVVLDTRLTPELEREGLRREFARAVQNARKSEGLQVTDSIRITVQTEDEMVKTALKEKEEMIREELRAMELVFGTVSADPVQVGGRGVRLRIERV